MSRSPSCTAANAGADQRRTAVMLRGEVVAEVPTEQIFNPPFHPYTEKLLSPVPEMRTDWLDDVLAKRKMA